MAKVSVTAIRPKKLQAQITKNLAAGARAQMQQYLELIKREMISDYDSVPPASAAYEPEPGKRRTKQPKPSWVRGRGKGARKSQNLKDHWVIHVNADGSEGTLTNSVSYAVYVQGPLKEHGRGRDEHQAQRMRAKGWRSITVVARESAPLFYSLMNKVYGPSPGSVSGGQ